MGLVSLGACVAGFVLVLFLVILSGCHHPVRLSESGSRFWRSCSEERQEKKDRLLQEESYGF